MKKIFALLFLSIALVGCSDSTSVKRITADLLTSTLSTAIVTTFDCAATSVVKTDVKTNVDKWFSVSAQRSEKGVVQEMCKTAIAEIVPSLIGTALPATWNCKITKVDTAASVLSTLVCSNIQI